MRRTLLAGLMLLALASCKKDEPKAADGDAGGTPRIASLDEYDLPVDRSAEITAIDAATGDASGMPRDGGAVVVAPKPQPRPTVQTEDPASAVAAPAAVALPAPPAPAPAITVPVGN